MKKMLALVLCASICFGLGGCSENKNPSTAGIKEESVLNKEELLGFWISDDGENAMDLKESGESHLKLYSFNEHGTFSVKGEKLFVGDQGFKISNQTADSVTIEFTSKLLTLKKSDENSVAAVLNPNTNGHAIELNKRFTVDGIAEMEVNSIKWEDEILPSNTSESYSYSEDVEGETFLVIRGKIKNLSSQSFDPQFTIGFYANLTDEETVDLDKGYSMTGIVECEEPNGSNFWGDPKSLQELPFVASVSVSDNLRKIQKSGAIVFAFPRTESMIGSISTDENTYNVWMEIGKVK